MEKVSGRDLRRFFDEWIYGAGHPELELDWTWDEHGEQVVLSVRQMQQPTNGTANVFHFPVDVEVLDEGGTALHRIEISERRQSFELHAPDRPLYVRFDVHGWVPKTVTWDRDPEEWMAIAIADSDVNGRRDAVTALGRLAGAARIGNNLAAHEVYVAEVASRLRKDDSPHVRASAALALASAGGVEARERLIKAAQEDPSTLVRVRALRALWCWGEDRDLARLAREVFEEGYSWATMGTAAGLMCSADPEQAYGWITGKLFIDSPHDQLRGYLLGHLGTLSNPGVSDQLLRWARDDSVHPTARAAALSWLPRQPRKRIANARAVVEFLDEESFHLRQAAVEALAEFDDSISRRALEEYYPRAVTARERRAIEAALHE